MRAHELIPLLLITVPVALMLAMLTRDRAGHLDRELGSVRRRDLGRLREGMFRAVGRVRPGGALLTAPVSGRPCLAWRLVVVQRPGGSRCFWSTAVDMSAGSEFWIEDASGRAAVQPGLQFVFPLDARTAALRGQWDQLPADVEQTLARLHGQPAVRTATWLPDPGRWWRFTEARIEPDQMLSVGGEVHQEPHPLGEVCASRGVPMRWVFRGTAENPLILVGGTETSTRHAA